MNDCVVGKLRTAAVSGFGWHGPEGGGGWGTGSGSPRRWSRRPGTPGAPAAIAWRPWLRGPWGQDAAGQWLQAQRGVSDPRGHLPRTKHYRSDTSKLKCASSGRHFTNFFYATKHQQDIKLGHKKIHATDSFRSRAFSPSCEPEGKAGIKIADILSRHY